MAVIDWIIVGAYLVLVLGVGVFFMRRAGQSTDEFFVSGRNLPWWLAGTSMVATSFAADTPLAVTGWVRNHGISFNWIWWSFAIGGMFSVFFLSRLWRRAAVVTDVELTELRYSGRSAAALRAFRGAYMAIPVNCITMGWVILAMIKILKTLLGIDPVLSVAICLALTTVYAVMSGFWGIVVTDLLQFVMAMVGAIALCVLATSNAGGLAALRAKATAESAMGEQLLDFFPRLSAGGIGSAEFWSGPFFAFCVFLSVQWWANKNADGGGVVVQRMLASRSETDSLRATLWFNIANYAIRPWPWIVVALASIALFPRLTGSEAENAYPMMILHYAPAGLTGLMVASFLGAFMSTIDTHLNLSSAYLVNDIYRRFIRRDASEKHYVLVSRIASLGFMLLASLIAIFSDSISDLFVFLLAFTSGFGAVLILRWFWWRINAWSELSAMIASGAISITLYVLRGPLGNPSPQLILLLTVGGSTAVWVAVTFLTAPVSQHKLAAFYRKVRPYGAWGGLAAATGVTPDGGMGRMMLNWVAGSVMVLAAMLAVGKLLLGEPLVGGLYLTAAIVGAVIIWPELRRKTEGPQGPGVGGTG